MMKLTRIVVGVWNQPDGRYTRLIRYYDNPSMDHMVLLNPSEVETYLRKDSMNHPIEPGIHHLTRPL